MCLEVLNALQKQKIERLIGELKNQDMDVRNSAAEALGQMGKDVVPALILGSNSSLAPKPRSAVVPS